MVDKPIPDAVFHSWRMGVITTASRLGLFTRLEDGGMNEDRLGEVGFRDVRAVALTEKSTCVVARK